MSACAGPMWQDRLLDLLVRLQSDVDGCPGMDGHCEHCDEVEERISGLVCELNEGCLSDMLMTAVGRLVEAGRQGRSEDQ